MAPVGEKDRRVLIQARSRFNGVVRGVPPLHDHIGPKGEIACLLLRLTPAGDSHIQLGLAVRRVRILDDHGSSEIEVLDGVLSQMNGHRVQRGDIARLSLGSRRAPSRRNRGVNLDRRGVRADFVVAYRDAYRGGKRSTGPITAGPRLAGSPGSLRRLCNECEIAKQSISGPGLTMRAVLLCIPALCRADSCGLSTSNLRPGTEFHCTVDNCLRQHSDRKPENQGLACIDGAPMSRMPFLFAVHFRRPGVAQFLAGSVHSGFYFPDLPHLTSNSAFSLFAWTGDVISICSQPL